MNNNTQHTRILHKMYYMCTIDISVSIDLGT